MSLRICSTAQVMPPSSTPSMCCWSACVWRFSPAVAVRKIPHSMPQWHLIVWRSTTPSESRADTLDSFIASDNWSNIAANIRQLLSRCFILVLYRALCSRHLLLPPVYVGLGLAPLTITLFALCVCVCMYVLYTYVCVRACVYHSPRCKRSHLWIKWFRPHIIQGVAVHKHWMYYIF